MSTREQILNAVLDTQPPSTALPDIDMFKGDHEGKVEKYIDIFRSIGGAAFLVEDFVTIKSLITEQFEVSRRVVTTLNEFENDFEMLSSTVDPHRYEDIELAVIRAHLAVAENGAVWLTEQSMGQRIIPYICQHLAVVVAAEDIVPTLHEAYELIGEGSYGFAGFIGGPSKTADIEQALVLGAHGPLSMTVFVLR